ncbi:MAG TPA: DUF3570 domain-containing protein [Cellvibrio sp.]|nr:DUF3570 domain-containing protein [Cellvibrio sp.]
MKKNINAKNSPVLLALTTAAMILPGISKKADANPMDQATTFDAKHSIYEEGALPGLSGSSARERYTINATQFKFKTPVLEDSEIGVSGVFESMSGASPWYVRRTADGKLEQVMSGATIDEERTELGASYRSFNKTTNSENTLSAGYSEENDYRSLSFGFSGVFYVNQQLTTLEYGVNTSKDYIDASDPNLFVPIYPARPTNEMKNRLGMMLGASHIATKNTLVSATLSYALLDGYLSDPYKMVYVNNKLVPDNRPYWNEQFALTLMLREFFPSVNGALHVDYRFYSSTWNVDSHTLELAWYQNLGAGWQIIPSIRTYTQTQAEFYAPVYDTARTDGYYSNDYRLSDFDANSAQLKVVKAFERFNLSFTYETYDSSGDNPGLVSYDFYSIGTSIKF